MSQPYMIRWAQDLGDVSAEELYRDVVQKGQPLNINVVECDAVLVGLANGIRLAIDHPELARKAMDQFIDDLDALGEAALQESIEGLVERARQEGWTG